jgi:AraC-like DNA-binding protein
MEMRTGAPAPRLRGLVDAYVDYRQEGGTPGVHRGLPSGALTLVVSTAGPIDVLAADGTHLRASMLLGGLHDQPVRLPHDGNQRGVQLALSPLGVRALLGLPAAALAHGTVALDDVLKGRAGELQERLATAASAAARFAVLDGILAPLVRDRPVPAPQLRQAWRLLVTSDGSVPIAAIAREVGWSRRHLGERFHAEFGLSPQVTARILRFGRARALLHAPARPALATLAAVAGYTDQAHLTREWRALAGCTPGQWIQEELDLQREAPAA